MWSRTVLVPNPSFMAAITAFLRLVVLALLNEAHLAWRYSVVLYQLALDFRIHVPPIAQAGMSPRSENTNCVPL